jgi:hypothetical protein
VSSFLLFLLLHLTRGVVHLFRSVSLSSAVLLQQPVFLLVIPLLRNVRGLCLRFHMKYLHRYNFSKLHKEFSFVLSGCHVDLWMKLTVTLLFHLSACPFLNPSSRTMALGLTQPLTEMSTRYLPGGKGTWRLKLTTSPPSVSDFLENMWALTSHNPMRLDGLLQG